MIIDCFFFTFFQILPQFFRTLAIDLHSLIEQVVQPGIYQFTMYFAKSAICIIHLIKYSLV